MEHRLLTVTEVRFGLATREGVGGDVRLRPLEMYILDRFRDLSTTQLTLADIIGDCTLNRFQALWNALLELEFQHGLLRQQTDAETFELTPPAIGKMGLEFLPQTRGNRR